MGVKSSMVLTRDEAEYKYIYLRTQVKADKWLRKAKAMTTTELEEELERLNDLVNNGEGFENYIIVEEK